MVSAIGARSLVVELQPLQTQTIGFYRSGIERNTTEAGLKGRSASWTAGSAPCKRGIEAHWVNCAVGTLRDEIEVEDEGIILADVGSISLVFKGVVEHTEPATSHEFGGDLICEADTRREIVFLRLHEALPVFAGADQAQSHPCATGW